MKAWERVCESLFRELSVKWGYGYASTVSFAGRKLESMRLRWEEVGEQLEDGAVVMVEWHELFMLVLEGHTDIVYSVASLGDGRLASGSFDKTVRIWGV